MQQQQLCVLGYCQITVFAFIFFMALTSTKVKPVLGLLEDRNTGVVHSSTWNWWNITCTVPVYVSQGDTILAAASTGSVLQNLVLPPSNFLTFLSYIFLLYPSSQYSYLWKTSCNHFYFLRSVKSSALHNFVKKSAHCIHCCVDFTIQEQSIHLSCNWNKLELSKKYP